MTILKRSIGIRKLPSKEMQGLNTNLAWRMPLGMVLRKITLKRSIGIRKLPSKEMQGLNTNLAWRMQVAVRGFTGGDTKDGLLVSQGC